MTKFQASRRLAILASVAMVALLLVVPGVRAADSGTAQTYLVVFKAQALPANAAASITAAGGTVVYSYPQIGVVIARSSSATFRGNLMRSGAVRGAASTAGATVSPFVPAAATAWVALAVGSSRPAAAPSAAGAGRNQRASTRSSSASAIGLAR